MTRSFGFRENEEISIFNDKNDLNIFFDEFAIPVHN